MNKFPGTSVGPTNAATANPATTRVALLTEIIAPYRIPVFNALARQKGIDLHVIFLAETDPAQRQWRVYKDEIEFSYEVLPAWRWRWGGWQVLLNRRLWAALDGFRPRSILCGGYNHPAFWQAQAWAKFHATHFAAWIESTRQDRRQHNLLAEFSKRQFIRNCNTFAVPGKSSTEYLNSMGVSSERIHTAPNAVDIRRFANLARAAKEQAAQRRAELGLPSRYFLYAGRIIPEKGVFHLLQAYIQLPSELRSRMGLVFVGDGPAKAELRAELMTESITSAAKVVPGTVLFPGFAQRDQLAGFYALAEVLVFPTLSDPWGLVVNEAMACGLPIIATDVAGCTADLVRDGENGFVIPSANVGSLTEAMAAFARDPQLASRMGERSATLIETFSPESCAAGLAKASVPTP
jgi:glycosyltransferase involved in cell wall biosynthesis